MILISRSGGDRIEVDSIRTAVSCYDICARTLLQVSDLILSQLDNPEIDISNQVHHIADVMFDSLTSILYTASNKDQQYYDIVRMCIDSALAGYESSMTTWINKGVAKYETYPHKLMLLHDALVTGEGICSEAVLVQCCAHYSAESTYSTAMTSLKNNKCKYKYDPKMHIEVSKAKLIKPVHGSDIMVIDGIEYCLRSKYVDSIPMNYITKAQAIKEFKNIDGIPYKLFNNEIYYNYYLCRDYIDKKVLPATDNQFSEKIHLNTNVGPTGPRRALYNPREDPLLKDIELLYIPTVNLYI